MNLNKPTITLCASVSFYKQVLEIESELRKLGFKTKVPKVARIMGRTGNFDAEEHKTWLRNPDDFKVKTHLMNLHFQKVRDAHAILVVNYSKNGFDGYIGGNGLMEMTLAYLDKKPIFVLFKPNSNLPVYEEVIGMRPVFLEGDISKIKSYLPSLKRRYAKGN